MDKRKGKAPSHIPQREIEALARRLLPGIREYFESEQGQKDYKQWKEQKKKEIK